MPVFNTLQLKNRLAKNGMSDTQAEDFVYTLDEALTDVIRKQVASKTVTIVTPPVGDAGPRELRGVWGGLASA